MPPKITKAAKKVKGKIHPDIGYLTGIVTGAGVVAIIAASEEMENKKWTRLKDPAMNPK